MIQSMPLGNDAGREAIMAQACKVFGQGRRQIKCRGSWGVEIAKKVSYFRRNRSVCSGFHQNALEIQTHAGTL